MSVAVITYTSAQNWGGQLQAYGLLAYLRSQGIACDLINYRKLDDRLFRPKREITDVIASAVRIFANRKRVQRFRDFRRDFLGLAAPVFPDENALAALNDAYDVFLTGSDQLWNCETEINRAFYLAFTQTEKRRVAYAPSFGSSHIPEQFEQEVAQLLGRYEALSVREKSGAALIRRLTGRSVPVLPDPVFLLSAQEWLQHMNVRPQQEKYLFVYATEHHSMLVDAVRRFQRERPGVQIVSPYAIPGVRVKLVKDIGPREFVSWLAGADFVIASSFHAVAFALIFDKPFAAVKHSTRSARITDLLEDLNAVDRLWTGQGLRYDPPRMAAALEPCIQAGKTYLKLHLEDTYAAL